MRGAADQAAEVAGEGADVGAGAAGHAHVALHDAVRVAPGEHVERVDAHARRRELDRLAGAREVVRPAALDALGGVRGRNLVERADQLADGGAYRGFVRRVGLAEDGAVQVLGVRLGPEPDRRGVHLGVAADVRHEPRRAPGEHHEQAGRERVERARVADAPLA